MAQSQGNLDCIKSCLGLGEPAFTLHVLEEFTTCHVLNHKVYSVASLKHKLHLHNEGVVHLQHYHALQIHIFNGVLVHDDVLAHALHSEVSLLTAQVRQKYFTEGASAEDTHHLKFL